MANKNQGHIEILPATEGKVYVRNVAENGKETAKDLLPNDTGDIHTNIIANMQIFGGDTVIIHDLRPRKNEKYALTKEGEKMPISDVGGMAIISDIQP